MDPKSPDDRPQAAEPQPLDWRFAQVFGERGAGEDVQEVDIISAIEFDKSGDHLATGDRGGRVVLFERTDARGNASRTELERQDYPVARHPEFRYKTEFQSHEPEFDYLKSLEIEEKINKIKWGQTANSALFILSTNDKTIKYWKVQDKKVKRVSVMNLDTSQSSDNGTPSSSSTSSSRGLLPNGGCSEKLCANNDLSLPPGGCASLRLPVVVTGQDLNPVARCWRVYAHAHDYHINSISNNSDGETFISADDLRINLWNLEINSQSFNIVDVKPANMEDLTEVITCAEFHPTHCNTLAYSTSKGAIRLIDLRQSALCDNHSKLFEEHEAGSKSFFTEIIASVSDIKFARDGRHILSRDYMTLKLKAKPDVSWCPPEQGTHGVADILELNRIGLPIRKGARNCTYYMRNGACRYGKHCHFNHPEHVIDAQFYAQTGWEDSTSELDKSSDHHTTLDDTSHLKKSSDNATLDDTSYSKKSSDHATLDGTSYSKKSSDHASIDDTSSSSEVLPPNILRMLLPPQKVLPGTEGKVMQVKKDSNWSSTLDDSDGCCSADSSDGPLCKQEHVDNSDGPLCKQEQVDYPERPGRPECPYYGRSGDCKFASACNYHHPKYKYPPRYHLEFPSLGGEQTEYPERPGEPECLFYIKNGFCGFGAKCWFNHPKDLNLTAQSATKAKKSVATDEHHQSTRITLEDHMPQQQQYPERPGQPDCRYYIQFGKCKFLSACIFHHPRDRPPVGWNPSGPAHSDQIGPEIDDMPECPFYVKSGKCHFGAACEFRHPKDICSTTEGAFGHRIDLRNDNFTRPENVVQKQEHTMYPERPGEPQCFHYMSHGSCKFQMNCKYHHPADRLSRKQYDSTYR